MQFNRFWQLQSKYRPIYPYTPVGLDMPTHLSPDNDEFIYGVPQENQQGFNYGLLNTPLVFPWMNDPTNILYNPDTKMYHRWGLYRSDGGFNSSWVEHIAPSLHGPWKQTQNALPKAWLNDGMENGTKLHAGWTGGSTIIDWNGVWGYGQGTVFFIVSLSGSGIYNGQPFTDQSIAWAYAPAPKGKTNGLGAKVYKGGMIFAENQTISEEFPNGTDWRDCRVVYDLDNKQFVMAISNHNKIQFWCCKISRSEMRDHADIRNWQHTSTFDTGYDTGIECPALNKIKDSKTGSIVWTLVCGKQIPGGKDLRQSVLTWVGSWDGKKFFPAKSLTSDATDTGACQLDYGSECYAPAINDPYGYDGQRPTLPSAPDSLYWSTYLGNWAEIVWNNPAYGYAGGTWEVRGLNIKQEVPVGFPLPIYLNVDYQQAVNLHTGPIKYNISNATKHWTSRLTMHKSDQLTRLDIVYTWSNGNYITISWKNNAWTIDRQKSGLFTFPDTSNNPMPNFWGNGWSDLIIHYDNSQFVFWDIINGRVASFWIFPEDLYGQGDQVKSIELKSVTVTPTPSQGAGINYYFGIQTLSLTNTQTSSTASVDGNHS